MAQIVKAESKEERKLFPTRKICGFQLIGRLSAGLQPCVFLAGLLCLLSVIFSTKAACNEYYADPVNGSDAHPGTLSAPVKTVAKGISRLKAGDTLYLRAGTYWESDISIAVRGTASQPITIKNYPGEKPIIDGGYREFRTIDNNDWELVDVTTHLYRSKKTYPDPEILHGYFEFKGVLYKLVGYDHFEELSATKQYYSETEAFYVGPGAHWRRSDKKLYVRLQQSDLAKENGYALGGLPTDPRQLKISLFGNSSVLRIENTAAHIRLEGLTVCFQEHALEFVPGGAHHFSAKNCHFLGGRFHIFVGSSTHDLLFDGITIHDAVPDWIAWLDVKLRPAPAKHLQAPGLKLTQGVHNIEVRNSSFKRLFDGCNANGGGCNIYFHHNIFEDIRDDCFQFGTHTYGIEIAYNKMIRVSKGPGFQGTTDSEQPGTKYYHHNIIDCSKLMQFARRDAGGKFAMPERVKYINARGQVWARPIGFHGERNVNDPWKLYHNTIIFGQELNATGAGHEYPHRPFDPATPQEVYNNIIIQVADYWVSSGTRVGDGCQIHDGNLYYRTCGSATHPFFNEWSGAAGIYDFQSLAEFRTSPLFDESKRYYASGFEKSGAEGDPRLDSQYSPDPKGPAASGAVPLPADWPGNKGETFRGAMAPYNN